MADTRCASGHPWGANTRTEVPQGEHRMGDVEPATVEYAVRARQHYAAFEPVDDLETAIAGRMMALFALFRERQRKYGPGNIAAFGDYGVLVRCHDKLARLKRHYVEGTGDMPDESVDDAWSDLAVYAVIALVCRKGAWPGLTRP